ncbi:MAG: TonB-dependent receptor, partial [Longimicrobiales bacterium]
THYGAEVGWGSGAGDDAGRPTAASTPTGDPRVHGVEGPAGAGRAGLQASVSRLVYDGFREHAAADKRFASVRGQWTGVRDAVRVVGHAVAYEAENPGSLSSELMAEDRTQAYTFNVAQATGEAAEQAQVGVTWRRALGRLGDDPVESGSPVEPPAAPRSETGGLGARSLEVTGWALARDLDNPIPPVIIDLSRRAAGVRVSVRGSVAAAGRAVGWVAGLDAGGQWDDRENRENEGGRRGALVLDQAESVTTVAPFAELSAPVAGPVSALAGLRYDRHRFSADDRLIRAGDPGSDASGARLMDQVSPSLGLTAELGATSGYVSVASSFETPTTTELVNRPSGGAGFNPELEPQRAWSVEAGVRTRARGRVRLHLAAYRTAIRDGLIPFEVPSEPGRTFFRNAGSAIHRGLELDGWAGLGGGLSARLGYAWVDARFDDYVTPDGDRSGNRVPGVAPHRLTGGLTWVGGAGRVALSGRWIDAIPANDENTARAPSYTLLDIRLATGTLGLAAGSLEMFAGVDNVLDVEYTASLVVNAFGGRYYEPGPGRSVYAGVRLGM